MKKILLSIFISCILISCDFSTEPLSQSDDIIIFRVDGAIWSDVTVRIQNMLGEEIKNLDSESYDYPLTYKWNGRNENGEFVEDGFYIAYLKIEPDFENKRVIYFNR